MSQATAAVRAHTFTSTIAQQRIARLLHLLGEGPLSSHDVASKMHMSPRCARDYLSGLKAMDKIHIASWHKEPGKTGTPLARWRAGTGQDAPRPPSPNRSERGKVYRARVRQDPEKSWQELHKQRTRRILNGLRRDPAVAMLFGPPPGRGTPR